jgi:regulator of RNase E activity RraA
VQHHVDSDATSVPCGGVVDKPGDAALGDEGGILVASVKTISYVCMKLRIAYL